MKKVKESISIKLHPFISEIQTTMYFSIKDNSEFKFHTYFIDRNLRKEYAGSYMTGYFLDLNDNLNLKQFKIEIFK